MGFKRKTTIIVSIVFCIVLLNQFIPVKHAFAGDIDLFNRGEGGTEIGRRGTRSQKSVIAKIRPKNEKILKEMFRAKGLTYPPEKVKLIAVKDEGVLEIWAAGRNGKWTFIKEYEILALSGEAGPKLRQGDSQVPEGLYSILWQNPNSSYHLSMKINYPNAFDKEKARLDKRSRLGGDIFIHGSSVSIGCLAMGNEPIEELYLLVNDTGAVNTNVIITPYDFRKGGNDSILKSQPEWVTELYDNIKTEIMKFKRTSKE